jgi:ubiquinone/menaquinone biosynthesis C-methylase UbiE
MADRTRGQSTLKGLLEHLQMKPGPDHAMLDLGCGFGNLVIASSAIFGRVCGMDIVEERTVWCAARSPGAQIVCGDATAIPWADNSFDLVISTDVFEHLNYTDQSSAAREILRVLRSGGHAFVTVPNRLQLIDEHNGVLFGTWLPDPLRSRYTRLVHKNYLKCWERTEHGWARLFRGAGLATQVRTVKGWFPARCELFLTKTEQNSLSRH